MHIPALRASTIFFAPMLCVGGGVLGVLQWYCTSAVVLVPVKCCVCVRNHSKGGRLRDNKNNLHSFHFGEAVLVRNRDPANRSGPSDFWRPVHPSWFTHHRCVSKLAQAGNVPTSPLCPKRRTRGKKMLQCENKFTQNPKKTDDCTKKEYVGAHHL